ncbi:FAD-dependent oxidoreductase [Thioalkalivibrio sp. XN8]|uniref:NAD(P)/FAD-dependent oxidoreductase n=1 Tax=Thioalkalivibrio sp. XN8 TaxID=2712863 RepID=UPI0013EBEC2A|nr:FAD-dependent oxidoreductase [Thioalkalivibrio sp. XN8]NGP53063.1 FAD-dependent oxidoreductase [Thioalkalivibrio sp. XN8]
MRIVVVGGGYAGLACLARLARVLPDAERHLVDPGRWHLRRTLLHETLRRPLADLHAGFGPIARRWDFRHHAVAVRWDMALLRRWSQQGRLRLGRKDLEFDALVLATGLPGPKRPRSRSKTPPVPLESLATGAGIRAYRQLAANPGPAWVVGAGASGLQCVFELAAARERGAPLGLVEASGTILPAEPARLRRVVWRRLERLGVDVRLDTRYQGAGRGRIRLLGPDGAESLPAGGVLLCTGPTARPVDADAAGRVLHRGRALPGIFAAGDCARWRDVPFDAATAQTAVRKGRHVAESVARVLAGDEPEAWDAQQLGYFLSLGPGDAVGWLFSRAAMVKGLPAVAAREAIEARWDLLLAGVDSFGAL